jgi:chromosomal replication initiation ATPase DnaA
MSGTLKDWIEGFEREMHIRFNQPVKVLVLEQNQDQYMKNIVAIVSSITGVAQEQIMSEARGSSEISDARMIAMYFIHQNKYVTKSKIGDYFGNRHHTSVIYAIRTVTNRIHVNDDATVRTVKQIQEKLKSQFNEQVQDQ